MRWKLSRVFVCGKLLILYSKINLWIHFFNSIFNIFGKNKMKGCRLSCYYVSLGSWVHEPRILDTYKIGAYIIDTFNGYSVFMF